MPRLVDKAHELGFEVRGGDLFRDARLHGKTGAPSLYKRLKRLLGSVHLQSLETEGYSHYGASNSEHKNKCAIDLNLRVRDGSMVWNTEGHRKLGEWWEEQDPMCRWGGRFNDGNHYEFLQWRDKPR